MTTDNESGGRRVALILKILVATLLFTIFRMLPGFLGLGNRLADRGWSLLTIILVTVLVQMLLTGIVVLFIMPPILGGAARLRRLPAALRLDGRGVLLGLLSFVLFGALATALALGMGIFRAEPAVIVARPDLRPDPDVVGWGYLLLALVPGIWEELAFRGLVQGRARQVFSTPMAIFLSAFFFALFHVSLLATSTPDAVVGKVLMAFLFGIGWGYMTVRARSVVPAILSHYLVDGLGQIFINVDSSDPALAAPFFLLLTLIYPVLVILLTRILYRASAPRPRQALEF